MPIKTGNVIDYRDAPGMDNADEGEAPKMGFGGMGFGRLPSQQNKIDEKSELGNLVKQYRTAAVIAFVLLAFIYVSTNLMFGGSDWYEVANIIEIAASAAVLIFVLRVLNEKYEGRYILGDDNRVYLNTNTVIASIIGVIFLAYIHINSTEFLVVLFRFPEEKEFIDIVASVFRTAIIFFTIALVAPTIAILFRLIVKELPDQYHGALEVKTNADKLGLDWAKFHEDNERYWNGSGNVIIDQPAQQKLLGHHIVTNPAAARSITPRTEDQYFSMLVNEFLDGIESGAWSTSERSWKKKRLVRSGVDLPVVGDSIRDALIAGGWSEWVHPNQPHLGWRLISPISEIRRGALLQAKKQLTTTEDEEDGTDTETTGQDSEESGGTSTWSPENWS